MKCCIFQNSDVEIQKAYTTYLPQFYNCFVDVYSSEKYLPVVQVLLKKVVVSECLHISDVDETSEDFSVEDDASTPQSRKRKLKQVCFIYFFIQILCFRLCLLKWFNQNWDLFWFLLRFMLVRTLIEKRAISQILEVTNQNIFLIKIKCKWSYLYFSTNYKIMMQLN